MLAGKSGFLQRLHDQVTTLKLPMLADKQELLLKAANQIQHVYQLDSIAKRCKSFNDMSSAQLSS